MSADACLRVSDSPDLMRGDAELTAAGRKPALRFACLRCRNSIKEWC